jgi:hypothetical protein
MSDFEQLEKDLTALTPSPPTREFTQRVERALGDTGTIAMRHSPTVRTQSNDSPLQYGSLLRVFFGFGLAASIAVLFYFFESADQKDTDLVNDSIGTVVQQPYKMVEDEESPLHGTTLDQLEDFSGIPIDGWLDPRTEEKFIRRVDEGIVDRASGLPARQYRYHYVDETLWTHPATSTRVLSSTPRQEVYLIDLELY